MSLLERRRAMISALAKSPSLVFLEYIQSSGTQYIKSGITGNQNTRIKLKCNASSYTSGNSISILGAYTDNYNSITIYVGGNARSCFGNASTYFSNFPLNTDHVIELDKTNLVVDGTTATEDNNFPSTNNFNTAGLYVIGRNVNGSLSGFFGKTYYCQIWENDTLVRDFVPCKKGNEVGLYDLVNHVFYGNDGTGSFIAGPDIGYQFVEYIGTDGTQYIDTGVLTSYNLNIDVDIAITESPPSIYKSLFGNRSSWVMNFTEDLTGVRWVGEASKKFQTNYVVGKKYNFKLGKDYCKKDGISINSSYDANDIAYGNFLIGRALRNIGKAQFYKFRISDGNILVRNLIPCYRKSDHVAGMYDLVTNTFYTNAGTGDFIVGPDLN